MPSDSFIVAVRIRPTSSAELSHPSHRTIIAPVSHTTLVYDPPPSALSLHGVQPKSHSTLPNHGRHKDIHYTFDHVFDSGATQSQVYAATAAKVVSRVLDGYNATVFAYGATGAGKTHTMIGNSRSPGIMVQTMRDVFNGLASQAHRFSANVSLSYLEIYNEQIRDLLSPSTQSQSLSLREEKDGSMTIAGLSYHSPKCAEEVFAMLERGNAKRTQSATEANAQSSRSHAILQVIIRSSENQSASHNRIRTAKLSLIDLAGSERAAVSKNRGQTLKEGANINRSLLALGNCINQLAAKAKAQSPITGKENNLPTNVKTDSKCDGNFVPYRDSKLTRLLKDSLGGRALTVMIANVSPSSLSAEDSHNTLKYANRAKDIQCVAVKHERSVQYHVSQYETVIKQLNTEIEAWKTKYHTLTLSQPPPPTSVIESWRNRLMAELNSRASIEKNITAVKCSLLRLNGSMALVQEQRDMWLTYQSSPLLSQTQSLSLSSVAGLIDTLSDKMTQFTSERLSLLGNLQKLTQSLNQQQSAYSSLLESMKSMVTGDPMLTTMLESECTQSLTNQSLQSSQSMCDTYSVLMNELRQQWKSSYRSQLLALQSSLTFYQSLPLREQSDYEKQLRELLTIVCVSGNESGSVKYIDTLKTAEMPLPLPLVPSQPPSTTAESEFNFQYAASLDARPSQLPDARFSSATFIGSQFPTATTGLTPVLGNSAISSVSVPSATVSVQSSAAAAVTPTPPVASNSFLSSNHSNSSGIAPFSSINSMLTAPSPSQSSYQSKHHLQPSLPLMMQSMVVEGDEDMSDSANTSTSSITHPHTHANTNVQQKAVRRLSAGHAKKYQAIESLTVNSITSDNGNDSECLSPSAIVMSTNVSPVSMSVSGASVGVGKLLISSKLNKENQAPSRLIGPSSSTAVKASSMAPTGLARLLRPTRQPVSLVAGTDSQQPRITPMKNKRPLERSNVSASRLRTPTSNSHHSAFPSPSPLSMQRKVAMRI